MTSQVTSSRSSFSLGTEFAVGGWPLRSEKRLLAARRVKVLLIAGRCDGEGVVEEVLKLDAVLGEDGFPIGEVDMSELDFQLGTDFQVLVIEFKFFDFVFGEGIKVEVGVFIFEGLEGVNFSDEGINFIDDADEPSSGQDSEIRNVKDREA